MSSSKPNKRVLQKKALATVKHTDEQSLDSGNKKGVLIQCRDGDSTVQSKESDKASIATTHAKDAPVKNEHEEAAGTEWYPIRHPRLPRIEPPRHFVNKAGVICYNATRKLEPLKKSKNGIATYQLTVGERQTSFKLEEIMVYTFSEEQFDKSKHYIYHKDGNQENCAWDNLIVCDLPTLQDLEIARLEKLHSGTKYTVVRNVHDTLTFERYLVSDAGSIYSLITRNDLRPRKNQQGYQMVTLCSDTDLGKTTSKTFHITVHNIVIQSFRGRRLNNLEVDHFSGKKLDNSLKNLEFVTRSENRSRIHGPIQTETRNMLREQGEAPKKYTLRPVPPVTEETKWKPVGILPWNGRSFSKYEVSDMGHVRKIGQSKLFALSWTSNGYAAVNISCDNQDLDGDLTTTNISRCHVSVSRLVANAFVDGYSEMRNVVRHLNGDRQDNRAQNLEWVPQDCSSIQRNSRRVVATLADDPEARKEFPSLTKAKGELRKWVGNVQYGKTVRKEVDWDGEKRMAIIQVF